jgi:hypothetical protein
MSHDRERESYCRRTIAEAEQNLVRTVLIAVAKPTAP